VDACAASGNARNDDSCTQRAKLAKSGQHGAIEFKGQKNQARMTLQGLKISQVMAKARMKYVARECRLMVSFMIHS
jgi:hypothetical protein